jgi:hypothetical protein
MESKTTKGINKVKLHDLNKKKNSNTQLLVIPPGFIFQHHVIDKLQSTVWLCSLYFLALILKH